MFTHLFYFLLLLRVIHEFFWIVSAKEKIKKNQEFKALTLSLKNVHYSQWPQGYKSQLIDQYISMFLQMVAFLGLFSQQWLVFLAFLVWDLLLVKPLCRKVGGLISLCLTWINCWISAAVFLFLLINHYHLKISCMEIGKKSVEAFLKWVLN